MFLLDTNIISEVMRPKPDELVRQWLKNQMIDTLFLSSITVAEIRYGIETAPNGKRKEQLRTSFEDFILSFFRGRVLSFDEKTSLPFAKLKAIAKSKGREVEGADAYIGAIAYANRMTVATRDTSPFEAMGLKVINPFI